MSLTRRVAHNTIIQLLEKTICLIFGLATVSLMTRYLGTAGFGEYTTITAFVQMFAILTDLGLYLVLLQMSSRPGADTQKVAGNIFTIKFFTSLFCLSLAPLVALFIPSYSAAIKIGAVIIAFSFFFSSLIQLLSAVFQQHLCMWKIALADVIGKVVFFFAILAIVLAKGNLYLILGAFVLDNFISFALAYLFSRKLVKITFRFDFPFWKEIFQKIWPIALSITFTLIYFKTDTFILSLTRPEEEVGIYGAAYRVLEILIMFPALFIGLAMPILTKSWATKDIAQFRRALQKSFDFLALTAVPLIAAAMFLAVPAVILIAGPDFAASGAVLKILIFAVGAVFIGSLFSHTAIAIEKQRVILWFYGLTAAVAITGYLILIPRFSYYGAAWMTVVSEFFMALSGMFLIRHYTKIFPSFKVFFKAVLASLTMAFFLHLLAGQNLFLLIFVGGTVYFLTLYLIKGINKETILEIIKVNGTNKI